MKIKYQRNDITRQHVVKIEDIGAGASLCCASANNSNMIFTNFSQQLTHRANSVDRLIMVRPKDCSRIVENAANELPNVNLWPLVSSFRTMIIEVCANKLNLCRNILVKCNCQIYLLCRCCFYGVH